MASFSRISLPVTKIAILLESSSYEVHRTDCNIIAEGFRFIYLAFQFS